MTRLSFESRKWHTAKAAVSEEVDGKERIRNIERLVFAADFLHARLIFLKLIASEGYKLKGPITSYPCQ